MTVISLSPLVSEIKVCRGKDIERALSLPFPTNTTCIRSSSCRNPDLAPWELSGVLVGTCSGLWEWRKDIFLSFPPSAGSQVRHWVVARHEEFFRFCRQPQLVSPLPSPPHSPPNPTTALHIAHPEPQAPTAAPKPPRPSPSAPTASAPTASVPAASVPAASAPTASAPAAVTSPPEIGERIEVAGIGGTTASRSGGQPHCNIRVCRSRKSSEERATTTNHSHTTTRVVAMGEPPLAAETIFAATATRPAAEVVDEPYRQLIQLSGVAVQARQST